MIIEKLSLGTGKLKVMIKDSIDIQGIVTTLGSRAFENAQPATQHAAVVDHILKADCEIIAKTTLHELAFGITGLNHHFGTPINPKYPELIPGGSSSGSAVAVAAQQADFTLGTDTGGSIRMPAACCGIYGLKPTFGRISRKGVYPATSSLDVVGPFTNTAAMLKTAMQIIDPTFNAHFNLDKPPTFACLDVEAHPEIWACIHDFLNVKNIQYTSVKSIYMTEAYRAGMRVINVETWSAYGALTATDQLGIDLQQRLIRAGKTTLEQLREAERIRDIFTQEINDLLDQYDVLLLPTLPNIPPKVIDAENTTAFLNLTALIRPFNLSGHPAISIPLETKDGFPVGMQLVAKHGEDEKLCAIAALLE